MLLESIDTVAKAIPAIISCIKVNFQTNPTYHRKVCASTFLSAVLLAKWLFSSAITNIFPGFEFRQSIVEESATSLNDLKLSQYVLLYFPCQLYVSLSFFSVIVLDTLNKILN